ncbi:hypothetical protein CNMCM5623_004138 [Aspergillus felis]|uniref:Uncharacterized protein n=1 Tax=Aspergillus felis TaxID=1287682 RepID=A0A8H6QRA6_9EURO|nr:hypothetical protein CNMCM5623_004138 [Aspergillus felis]KAF7177304.1 hypothetical protein CNMCM7691_005194 [Aspergillus felis]
MPATSDTLPPAPTVQTISVSDDELPVSPLCSIVDSSPGDPIAQYLINPFARHIFKTLLAIFAFLILSYQICGLWNEESVCDRRVDHLTFAVGLGILALMGYTYYLRKRIEKQQRVSASGEGKDVK